MTPPSHPAPPLRWLLKPGLLRRIALRYWVRDPLVGLTETAIYLALRLVPTDAASWFGAVIVKVTRLNYPASEQRARIALRRLRPDLAEPAAIERLWRCEPHHDRVRGAVTAVEGGPH
jgi:hypothetical protein